MRTMVALAAIGAVSSEKNFGDFADFGTSGKTLLGKLDFLEAGAEHLHAQFCVARRGQPVAEQGQTWLQRFFKLIDPKRKLI